MNTNKSSLKHTLCCVSLAVLAMPAGATGLDTSDNSAVNTANNLIQTSDKSVIGVIDDKRALLGSDYKKFRAASSGKPIPNQYIVVYTDDSVQQMATSLAGRSLSSFSTQVATDFRAQAVADLTANLEVNFGMTVTKTCLLYTSPSPRDKRQSRMPSSA